jgi:hypothetical protein
MNAQESEQLKAYLARISGEHREMKRQMMDIVSEYKAFRKAVEDTPKSITHELDSIPGRRIFYNLSQTQAFTADLAGQRAQPLNFLVSQDGPYVMTHYPMVLWRPSAPSNATQFGFWRPVATWPLPDQVVDGDRIDLSYEFVSGGSQRNFNNLPAGPIFSRPDMMAPLPVPTLFAPNEVIQMIPTYEAITFDGTVEVPTMQGTLQVTLPGYRIVNM